MRWIRRRRRVKVKRRGRLRRLRRLRRAARRRAASRRRVCVPPSARSHHTHASLAVHLPRGPLL
jgi:hypothetical protein